MDFEICDLVEKHVHPIIICDVLGHELLDLIDTLFESVLLRKLVKNREEVLLKFQKLL